MIEVLKAKIHRATVTNSNLNYNGSITIDSRILAEAGIFEYEKVCVVDINNGNRFETYVIKSEKKDGEICINGGAARLVSIDDLIIVIAYRFIEEKDAPFNIPRIILVDETNNII